MKRHLALESVVSPAIVGLGYEFVGLEYFAQGKHSILRVYIDCPDKISIDDCEKASHLLDSVLDVEADLVRGAYTLEVSSPGIDRKLFSLEQFPRFVGKQVSLTLETPLDGQRNFIGTLSAVNGEQISLEIKGAVINVNFANIAQANIIDEKARV